MADREEIEALLPNPGSDEAIDRGCTCPVLDNGHGRGAGMPGVFWYNAGCPLHWPDGSKLGPFVAADALSAMEKTSD